MGIGLTFEEYVELWLGRHGHGEPALAEAVAAERWQSFPMAPGPASSHLRSRGYDCQPELLETLSNACGRSSSPTASASSRALCSIAAT